MRRCIRTGFPVTVALMTVTAWLAGCQPEATPSEKQARLLAAENMTLTEQLAAHEARIESLQQEHAAQLKERDEQLAQSNSRNEALQKDLAQGIAERVNSVTTAVMNENAQLRKDMEQLKAEIGKLKDQIAIKARPLEGP